jgi:aquaporin Z
MSLFTRCFAEGMGTFWLVLGGCGSAVLAASYTEVTQGKSDAAAQAAAALGIGTVGVSFAFGLTVLVMAFAIGHISGCHLNPAVSFGLWAAKRFPGKDLLPYIVSQVIGATFAAACIYLIATGKGDYKLTGSNPMATNGFLTHSPQGYSFLACFVTEFVMTFFFLFAILGATDKRAPKGFAPIAIGLMLTLIHLISIPVTNTSVNPARSTGPALMLALLGGNTELLGQVWFFWLVPIAAAIAAGAIYYGVFEEQTDRVASEYREPVAR